MVPPDSVRCLGVIMLLHFDLRRRDQKICARHSRNFRSPRYRPLITTTWKLVIIPSPAAKTDHLCLRYHATICPPPPSLHMNPQVGRQLIPHRVYLQAAFPHPTPFGDLSQNLQHIQEKCHTILQRLRSKMPHFNVHSKAVGGHLFTAVVSGKLPHTIYRGDN